MILSQGSFSILFLRPLSAICMVLALFLLVSPLLPGLGKRREAIAVEEAS